ncbi:MAG TPA: alginate lyase family protein, partial [Vicinamibacterales bacterium]|nr:alginate lyase family protein [Vicinamibacterales bacterium]
RPRVLGGAAVRLARTIALSLLTLGTAESGLRIERPPQSEMAMATFEGPRVIAAAQRFLTAPPATITAFPAKRSAGGPHDFFSEGDYWWPDPKHPDGPYIRRDGESNPDNFADHRRALVRLSVEVPALTAAWKLTSDDRYAAHARRHLRAWFVDPATRMVPSLQYAQAIHGVVTGRGTGIIDTIHLVEVARAIEGLRRGGALPDGELQPIRAWFAEYVQWMTTHPYGIEERDAKNNHGTCWVMQVAAFASVTGDEAQREMCRVRFKTVLLPVQMAADGSFPLEIARTKPYGYSLFNLDAMATICQILSTPSDNLWTYQLADGRGMRKALEFMVPFIKDKSGWAHPRDVQYHDEWPMRQPSLLFGGLALAQPEYVSLWKTLKPDSTVEEVVRNFFIRQPLLWID